MGAYDPHDTIVNVKQCVTETFLSLAAFLWFYDVIAEVTCSAHAVGHAPNALKCPVRVLQLIRDMFEETW